MANKERKKQQRAPRMRLRLFLTFFAFVVVTFVLLWGFQILLLDRFYYHVTKSRMTEAAAQITELYESDPIGFEEGVNAVAVNHEFCAGVYLGEAEALGRQLVRVDFGGCYIHSVAGVKDSPLQELYALARKNGGEYFMRAAFPGFGGPGKRERVKTDFPFHRDYTVRDRLVYVSVREFAGGTLTVMLDTAETPVNMIKGALMLQLFTVTLVMLIAAGGVSNLLAKQLSRPIADVNRAAKKLTEGEYDVQFTEGGYREIYELSDTLNRAAEELQKSDTMQKELIANISHDLRTPLTLITGYCEMMRDMPAEMSAENMQVVLDETGRLSSLVSDLIDLSKYQSNAQRLEPEDVDMDFLLLETVERYRKLTEGKDYTFVYESIGPTFVRCDKKRILQVVCNLINNAMNYAGEDKTVLLTLARTAAGRVRVEITDHGEGIAKEDLPYIFDRYYKVDKVHKRAVTGTGLGLSIVKSILLAHDAAFGVRSEVGVGSTFYFEL